MDPTASNSTKQSLKRKGVVTTRDFNYSPKRTRRQTVLSSTTKAAEAAELPLSSRQTTRSSPRTKKLSAKVSSSLPKVEVAPTSSGPDVSDKQSHSPVGKTDSPLALPPLRPSNPQSKPTLSSPTRQPARVLKSATNSPPVSASVSRSPTKSTLPSTGRSTPSTLVTIPDSKPVAPRKTGGKKVGVKSTQALWMQQEERLAKAAEAKDYLMQLPTPGMRYVGKDGRLCYSEDRFQVKEPRTRVHPKIAEAKKRRTWTSEKEKWYRDMPAGVNIPMAGNPSEKAYAPRCQVRHSAWEMLTQIIDLADLGLPEGMKSLSTDMFTQEDTFYARPSIKLIVPDVLKALLVDDWENITKNNQLVPLPHPHPVTKILEDYAASEIPKRPAGSSHIDILEETLAGLKEYFDKSLGRILLYRFERAQYADMHKKWNSNDPEFQGKTASDTYGPEHLMRLMVSLPELIAQTNMDQQSVNRLREELAKFCTWLSKNTTAYFISNYESPSQDYIQKAKD